MSQSITDCENEAKEFASLAVENDKINNIDNAIFYYTEAVQSILEAIKLGSTNSILKKMAFNYVNRAEELKKRNGTSETVAHVVSEDTKEKSRAFYILTEAISEDEDGNYDDAVRLYQEAISLLLEISNSSKNELEKNELRNQAKRALERAEILRKPKITSEKQVTKRAVPPSSQPTFTTKEIAVLKSTSVINGRPFPPFIVELDYKEQFTYKIPFSDKEGKLALSNKQQSNLKGWIRPSEYIEDPKMIMAISCFSICQTIVTDCSFVASMAVAAQYERRFKLKLITNLIYPQNKEQRSVYNPCGKYMVKLHINGVSRKVIIDDFLPMGRNNKLLCSFSSNRSELWVSLLEKAYMKVMGGYDFPGSNSNIDLHALTGWIPERIPILQNDPVKFKAKKEFDKLFDHFHKGNCLITVATGTIADSEADRAGLVATHAYAMLDIREIQGYRLFMLKNPWSHLSWRGKFSNTDSQSWTPELQKALNYDLSTAQTIDNGVFWIDYDSLQHFFDVIYVNWTPRLFPFTTCIHDEWLAGQGPMKDNFSIAQNPQYRLKLKNPQMVSSIWILLTRHITDKDDFANNREFIALMMYRGIDINNSKIFYPNDPEPIIDGVRINTPHYLVKKIHNPEQDKGDEYILVVSQYEKSSNICFTLRVYCSTAISLTKMVDPYKYYKTVNGEWTSNSAGGCPNNRDTYHNNPVYQLQLTNNTADNRIKIDIKAPKDYAVGYELICVESYCTSNPNNFTKKMSGDYRRGFLVCEYGDVSGGIYNIRLSTFRSGQIGPFILEVGSLKEMSLVKLS